MDCQLSTLLPDIWVIQTLAQSNQIDVSLRLGLLEKLPETSNDGRNARELVSFRILESFLSQGAQSNSLTSSSPKIAFDQSERCEDVLKRILLETPASSLKAAGPDMGKWDVEAFIAHKRSTLGKNALEKLKDAIVTGSYSLLASIKEQSICANEVLHCKDQAPHRDTGLLNDKSSDEHAHMVQSREAKGESHNKDSVQNDEYDPEHGQNESIEAENDKGFADLNSTEERDKSEPHSKDNVQTERGTSSRCKDGFEQEIHRNVIDRDDAKDVIVTGDCDGCLHERDDIATKKNAFLSSQCSFSQGSVDCREQNVCMKCNKGGKLLVCSANSCLLVVHESCLGSRASFSTRGEFHCPFCAYSQAISEYMDTKRRAFSTRKDFATFVCLGAKRELKKQPYGSDMSKQHHLKHDNGLNKSIEPDNQDSAGQNNNKRRRKLEFEKEGCSSPSSGDNSPSERIPVDSTNGKAHPSKKYTREMKKTRPSEVAASEILRSKGENASDKDPGKNPGGKISPNIESADHRESSEDNDDSRAPKYPMRAQKHQKKHKYPKVPVLRRQRVKWTTAEEEKLEEGVRMFGGNGLIPWRKILEHGSNVFVDGRSAVDLKDKWRNLCRASPKT